MVCDKCGRELDDKAQFCIYCGAQLNKNKFCLVCGEKNKEDALFCQKCGMSFDSKEEKEDISAPVTKYNKIIHIVLFCFAVILLFMNFGVCFTNFLSIKAPHTLDYGSSISKSFSDAVQIVGNNSTRITGAVLNASYVTIILIVTIIGTFITLIVGLCLAFFRKSEFNKKPLMKKQVSVSLAFLLCGLIMMGLFRSRQQIQVDFSKDKIMYGGFVITSVVLSFIYLYLTSIHHLIRQIFGKKEKIEIIKTLFNLVITAVFIVLMFSASGSLITWTVLGDTWKAKRVMYAGGLMVELQDLPIYSAQSSVELKKLDSLIGFMFLFSLAVIIVMVVFFTRRFNQLDKKRYKISLVSGITAVSLGLIYLIIGIICTKNYRDAFHISASDKISLGAGPIIFIIFAVLLLALEIIAKKLIKKK